MIETQNYPALSMACICMLAAGFLERGLQAGGEDVRRRMCGFWQLANCGEKLAANVFSLCVRAGLDALSCQPALMSNRSTTLELTTYARMTQNECYAVGFLSNE